MCAKKYFNFALQNRVYMQAPQSTPLADESRSEEMRHYRLGNECYQRGDWKSAIQHYLEACEYNSESPARDKLNMVYSILEFYNKDIYGQ